MTGYCGVEARGEMTHRMDNCSELCVESGDAGRGGSGAGGDGGEACRRLETVRSGLDVHERVVAWGRSDGVCSCWTQCCVGLMLPKLTKRMWGCCACGCQCCLVLIQRLQLHVCHQSCVCVDGCGCLVEGNVRRPCSRNATQDAKLHKGGTRDGVP